LYKSPGFDWKTVNIVTIFVSVFNENGDPSDNFLVVLDGLRLENIASISPVYGLTGYSVVKNLDGVPIIKNTNTSNLVEFRFAIDIGDS
jgi:hypothetical protein